VHAVKVPTFSQSDRYCAKIVLNSIRADITGKTGAIISNDSNILILHARRETRHKSRILEKINFLIHTAGVAGSNPASPTMKIKKPTGKGWLLLL
jgi:hypothetical protein